jgi:hypothetical protein
LGAEASHCWTVLFRPAADIDQASPAALRFRLSAARHGLHIEIRKCRGRKPRNFLL